MKRVPMALVPVCVAWVSMSACAYTVTPQAPVTFDSTRVRISDGADSAVIEVEVARTFEQQSVGLMDRPALDSLSGMLFVFDSARSGGFWMWRTHFPLDVAFMDGEGIIRRILTLDPCESPDPEPCPEHRPGVEYLSALEVNAGWFQRHGLGVGAEVKLVEEAGRPPGR